VIAKSASGHEAPAGAPVRLTVSAGGSNRAARSVETQDLGRVVVE
jgi:hypothetical protein